MAFLVLISLLLLTQTLTAQAPRIGGVRVTIKRISVADGLPDRMVRSITQDSRGFIWIGTDAGVCRYDGGQFIYFGPGKDSTSISHNSVWTVCGDSNGVLWAGTMDGLNRYDPATRSFKKHYHNDADSLSLSHSNIHSIFVDQRGTLWVGTANGLNEFDRARNTWARYYPNTGDTTSPGENYINAILEDRQGTLWIAAGGTGQINGGGLFMFDRQHHAFTQVGPKMKVYSCYEDRVGDFWVGAEGPSLRKVDRTTGRFISIPLPKKDPGNPLLQKISAFCEDKTGFMWLATSGWGLLRYDKQTKSFTRYSFDPSNPETISSSMLNTVFADREGVVWVGTDRGGVNVISTSPFVHLHTLGSSLPLVSRIDVLFQDSSGLLWVASQGNGVWTYNLSTGASRCILPKGLVRSICQDSEGIIWIVDRFSLVRHDPRRYTTKVVWRVPLVRGVRDRLLCILIDSRNNFWLGGNASLFRVNEDFTTYSVFFSDPKNQRIAPIEQIRVLAEDRHGRIWLSTKRGVSRFDEKTKEFVRFEHNMNDSTSISSTDFCNVFLDHTRAVWVATGLGLNRFDYEKAQFRRFIPGSPLLPRKVNSPVEDEHGNFWYSEGKRIMKFTSSTGSFQGFDIFDGIEDVEVLDWSRARLMSGEILFGTNDGILVFHPDSIRLSTYIPPVVITGVRKLHQQLVLNRAAELLKEIVLTPRENVFTISFAALSYAVLQQTRYAYQLEGFDRNWVYCGTRREAMYTNLDPGRYTFRVKGSNHRGLWNEKGATLTVIVQPAYWQTWWFRVISFAAIATLLYSIYRYRVLRLLEIERMRVRIASDLHDDIGATLTHIVMQSELVQMTDDAQKIKASSQQIGDAGRSIISTLSDIVWSIDARNDSLGNLLDRMREFSSEVLSPRQINIHFDHSGFDAQMKIPVDVRQNVYLIFKEAVANIARHSNARNVHISLTNNADNFTMTISDDGKGFAECRSAAKRTGHGLRNMPMRAARIGGTMEIIDKNGVKVMLRMKGL